MDAQRTSAMPAHFPKHNLGYVWYGPDVSPEQYTAADLETCRHYLTCLQSCETPEDKALWVVKASVSEFGADKEGLQRAFEVVHRDDEGNIYLKALVLATRRGWLLSGLVATEPGMKAVADWKARKAALNKPDAQPVAPVAEQAAKTGQSWNVDGLPPRLKRLADELLNHDCRADGKTLESALNFAPSKALNQHRARWGWWIRACVSSQRTGRETFYEFKPNARPVPPQRTERKQKRSGTVAERSHT